MIRFLFMISLTLVLSQFHMASAVENVSVVQKYSLVGVIANGTDAKRHKGVAVIKDIGSNRSLTIGVGEFLPYSDWKVEAVMRDKVIVNNGSSSEELRHIAIEDTPTVAPTPNYASTAKPEISETTSGTVVVDPLSLTQKAWDEFQQRRVPDGDFDTGVVTIRPPLENGYVNEYGNVEIKDGTASVSDQQLIRDDGDSDEMDYRSSGLESDPDLESDNSPYDHDDSADAESTAPPIIRINPITH